MFNFWTNCVIAKDLKSCTYCCYDISMSRGNALALNRRNSKLCTAQFGLPDKGRAIKGLIVCKKWDLEPLYLLNGPALGCYQPSPEV